MFFGILFLAIYGLFFYYYHITRRNSLMYYSIAWLLLGVHYLLGNDFISLFALIVFSSFLWIGNIKILEENLTSPKYSHELKYLAVFPVLIYLYIFPKISFEMFILSGIIIIFVSLSLIIWGNSALKKIGLIQMIFGFFTLLYFWYSKIYYLQAISALILAYLNIKTILDITLVNKTPLSVNTDLGNISNVKPGIFIVKKVPKIFLDKGLVFSRNNSQRKGWFWITKLNAPNAISPTNLPKMLDIIIKYMKSAKENENHPIIVIDNLEYLIMENEFETVLRFLALLRDYAILHSATVFLGIDLDTLDNKKQRLIRRLMEE